MRKLRPSYLSRANTLAERLGAQTGEALKEAREKNGHAKDPKTREEALSAVREEKKKKVTGKKERPEDTLEHRIALKEAVPEYVYAYSDALEVLAWAKTVPAVSLDTETYGLLDVHHPIRLIQLSWAGRSHVLDCDHVSQPLVTRILVALKGKPTYVHNSTFDLPRLYRWYGVLLTEDIRDSMLASKHARAGEWKRRGGKISPIKHGLKASLKRECKVTITKDTGEDDKTAWDGGLTEEQLRYALDDVVHLKYLYDKLMTLVDERDVRVAYEDTRAVLPRFVKAMTRGVPIDEAALTRILQEAEEEADYWAKMADELAPEPPTYYLNKKKTRFEKKWVWGNTNNFRKTPGPGAQRGPLKALSRLGVDLDDLDERTLLEHLDDHPLVEAVYQYRQKASIAGKYRKWLPMFYEDGRVFVQFHVAHTVTNRTSTSDPNIQGLSKRKRPEHRAVVKAP